MKYYEIEWTPEKIKTFWSQYENFPGKENLSFARQRGESLLAWIIRHIGIESLQKDVLDYGCGAGYLLDILSRRHIQCWGVDLSPGSIDVAKERLADVPFVKGLDLISESSKCNFAGNAFQVIFLLETIEHVSIELWKPLAAELMRLLKPGGFIVVTTPYNENLSKSTLSCSQCGCRFHRVQHVHSFDISILSERLQDEQFEIEKISNAMLLPDWNIWLRSKPPKRGWQLKCPDCQQVVIRPRATIIEKIQKWKEELFHLVCIARKPL